MVITFKGMLIAMLVIETCLWIKEAWISDDRYRKIKKLESDKKDLLEKLNRERCRSEEYSDIIAKRDNELSIEKKKYKKCIEYIKKINKEYKNK